MMRAGSPTRCRWRHLTQAHRPDPRWRGPRRAAGAGSALPADLDYWRAVEGSGLWAGGNTLRTQAARRIAQASRRIRRIGGSVPRLTPCGSTVFSGHRLNSIPPRQPFRSGGRRLPLGEQNATSPSLFADPAGPRLVAGLIREPTLPWPPQPAPHRRPDPACPDPPSPVEERDPSARPPGGCRAGLGTAGAAAGRP